MTSQTKANSVSLLMPARPKADEAIILRTFSQVAIEDGRHYVNSGRVVRIAVSPDGSAITATTRGSAPKPYHQRIDILPDRITGWSISSSCTCHSGARCGHLAAVLTVLGDDRAAHADPLALDGTGRRPDIEGWLAGLQASEAAASEDYPPAVRERLFYQLGG
jgi:uncharacterized Zn finger protein